MLLVDVEKIRSGVKKMLEVNMGLDKGETVLVLTDCLTPLLWINESDEEIVEMVRRTILAKSVYEVAKEEFPGNKVEFYVYSATGRSGAEPGKEVEEKMASHDVAIAITSYSLTHTRAREKATSKGVRVASMPGFLAEMFYEGGPMDVDYEEIARETRRIAEILTKAEEAELKTDKGTNLKFSLKGRRGKADHGLFREKGSWGNLPAGEAYIAPLEGTANGVVVVEKEWYPSLKEEMKLIFKNGYVEDVRGGGEVGGKLRDLLGFACREEREEIYIKRRNLAELGIGMNPNAKRTDVILEAEKIKGTVHVAIGDNSHMGGKVESDLHIDFVIPNPTLKLGGSLILEEGKLKA